MRNAMYLYLALSFAAVFALASGPALAQESKSYGEKVHDQATRGAANVVTGWMDAPKKPVEESKDAGTNPLWPVTGTVKGAAAAIGRTAIGGAEVLTAPVPHNKQILDPEVFDEEDKVTELK